MYEDNQAEFLINDELVEVTQNSNYPWDGEIEITVNPAHNNFEFPLFLRIPGWCDQIKIKVNQQEVDPTKKIKNGFVKLERAWNKDDKVELFLELKPQKIYANPAVCENAGKVALQYGPLIYCLEDIDNGSNLSAIALEENAELKPKGKSQLIQMKIPPYTRIKNMKLNR